jgi:hypothetical protein
MAELRRFWIRVLAFLRVRRDDDELVREVDAHLALIRGDFIARGMKPEIAARPASAVHAE